MGTSKRDRALPWLDEISETAGEAQDAFDLYGVDAVVDSIRNHRSLGNEEIYEILSNIPRW